MKDVMVMAAKSGISASSAGSSSGSVVSRTMMMHLKEWERVVEFPESRGELSSRNRKNVVAMVVVSVNWSTGAPTFP